MESGNARKIMVSGSETNGNKEMISCYKNHDPREDRASNTSLHHRISGVPFLKDTQRPEIELRDVDPPHQETGGGRVGQIHTMWKGETVLFEGSRSKEQAPLVEGE